jgi:hypothetical protein
MTIKYQNGQTAEAVILSRTDTAMRVILRSSDDVLALSLLSGTWVTEDCEPVAIEFAVRHTAEVLNEEDFICSKDLAAHLIHLLLTDSSEDEIEPAPEVHAAAPDRKLSAAARIA